MMDAGEADIYESDTDDCAEGSGLTAPFPWFGGKSKVADLVWARFGVVPNYVEPFAGSLAVLLRRPPSTFGENIPRETINDYDGHVANFWRACKYDPDGVAAGADRIVHELDLHAVGDALFCRPSETWSMTPTEWVQWIRADERHYDAERAGQWAWFLSNWIGALPSVDAEWPHENAEGVYKRLPHLRDAGKGVSRQLPNIGNAGKVVWRQVPHLRDAGIGVSRKLPHIGTDGTGACDRQSDALRQWMRRLQSRLRHVRCCCGDWARVVGKSVTWRNATPCAMFLDPPYSAEAGRDNALYSEECGKVAHDVRAWCLTEGARPDMRIALCGYAGEHEALEAAGWSVVEWKASGGYANTGNGRGTNNVVRERIWFSPGCICPAKERQASFLD